MQLHQKGGAWIAKFRMTPRTAWNSVSEMGRPSPSARGVVVKKFHQGYKYYLRDGSERDRNNETHLTIALDASGVVGINLEVTPGNDEPRCLALDGVLG
jgi:hypothetical protein